MDTPPTEWRDVATYLAHIIPEGKRREAARATGIPAETLRRKIKGFTSFDIDELSRIAIYLGVETDVLVAEALRHKAQVPA